MSSYYLQACNILNIIPTYFNDDGFKSILPYRDWGSDNNDILILDTIGELIRINADYFTFCEYVDLLIDKLNISFYLENKLHIEQHNIYSSFSRKFTSNRFLLEFLCKMVNNFYKKKNNNTSINNLYIDAFKRPITGLSMAQQYLFNAISTYHSIDDDTIISLIT